MTCDHLCACSHCHQRLVSEKDISLGISLTILEWYERVKDKLYSDGYQPAMVIQAKMIIERESR